MITEEKTSRKEQVILHATEMFKDKGYAATSMRDLATSLGIEAASLYSHIKSKEEILQKICFGMANEFINGLDQVDLLEISASEKLRMGIISHTKVIAKDLAASAVFLNEYRYLSETYLQQFLLLRINYINRFKRFIEQGMKDGEFGNIDKKMAVMTIFSSLNWMPNWYNPVDPKDQEIVSNQLADLLINGLKQ
jgi:AcrR family transcriptional regulator